MTLSSVEVRGNTHYEWAKLMTALSYVEVRGDRRHAWVKLMTYIIVSGLN